MPNELQALPENPAFPVVAKEQTAQTAIFWKQFPVTLEQATFGEFDELLADEVVGTFRLGLTQSKDGAQAIKRFVDVPRSKHEHEKWRRCSEVPRPLEQVRVQWVLQVRRQQ